MRIALRPPRGYTAILKTPPVRADEDKYYDPVSQRVASRVEDRFEPLQASRLLRRRLPLAASASAGSVDLLLPDDGLAGRALQDRADPALERGRRARRLLRRTDASAMCGKKAWRSACASWTSRQGLLAAEAPNGGGAVLGPRHDRGSKLADRPRGGPRAGGYRLKRASARRPGLSRQVRTAWTELKGGAPPP